MNLTCETIVLIFRKIKQLITVIILKSSNEYHRKTISKSGHKMDLYPALNILHQFTISFELKNKRWKIFLIKTSELCFFQKSSVVPVFNGKLNLKLFIEKRQNFQQCRRLEKNRFTIH